MQEVIKSLRRAAVLFLLVKASAEVEAQQTKEQEKAGLFHHHRFTIMMANAHIPNMDGIEGQNKFTVVPAWGFDYDAWFNEKWAIGLHNELILQQYKVEKEEDKTIIERSYPVASTLVGLFKPGRHLTIISGIGVELEKSESLGLWKIGIDYGWELPKQFELSICLQYDNKFKTYDSWLFGIAVSKISSRKKHPEPSSQ
ncbi:hypothetical protein KJS94_14210 [Flavihumibacter rivuli]|uniref:hypothetical protein n=1 Tax=Flavihumibacter rivuli TaxID=2838156 RepID=UPI001BDF6AD4|nr:hypothetical protein [Flavihumibacter rivuli]ULQ55799.1 hypothetical protein KJS94_14210 [Flavihumibacter rivuli]